MDKVCTACGYLGQEKTQPKGTFIGEVGVWMIGAALAVFIAPVLLVIPLIYSIWRMTSRERLCPKCKNPGMIPVDSPMASKFIRDLEKPE